MTRNSNPGNDKVNELIDRAVSMGHDRASIRIIPQQWER